MDADAAFGDDEVYNYLHAPGNQCSSETSAEERPANPVGSSLALTAPTTPQRGGCRGSE